MSIIKQDIERALAKHELELYYQPKVNFLKGRVSGAECLIRWNHPDKGFISPDDFIPLAEEIGLITDITAYILLTAIKAVKGLRGQGFEGSLAINTSPLDFKTNIIIDILQEALAQKEISPTDIQIELTETATLNNQNEILLRLHQITDMGFKLVMDDFGTGYSSIDLLSQLPFCALKVDQGVIGRMAQSTKNTNIVNMVINMARTLRMDIVAEGIEDKSAYHFLAYAGCLEAQGYWISKPLPFEKFKEFVAANPHYPSSHLGMIYHAHMNNVYFRKSVLDATLYANANIDLDMASVAKPDICFKSENTRLGQWYFGIGQELSNRPHFQAIEEPHRRMHQIGADLFASKFECAKEMILAFNAAFEEVNKYLHLLEAELMAEESENLSAIHSAKNHDEKNNNKESHE